MLNREQCIGKLFSFSWERPQILNSDGLSQLLLTINMPIHTHNTFNSKRHWGGWNEEDMKHHFSCSYCCITFHKWCFIYWFRSGFLLGWYSSLCHWRHFKDISFFLSIISIKFKWQKNEKGQASKKLQELYSYQSSWLLWKFVKDDVPLAGGASCFMGIPTGIFSSGGAFSSKWSALKILVY